MTSTASSSKSAIAAPLRLLLGGDVMLGRLVNRVIKEEGPGYPFAVLSELIDRADLFFINLESALSDRQQRFAGEAKAFYFRADRDAVRVLALAQVDLVSLANNHVLDADVAGLVDTLTTLTGQGIASVGAGPNLSAASAMCTIECKGARVGVLAACDHQADFAASEHRPGIHYLNLRDGHERRRLVDLVRAQAPNVDHLIVSLHWLPNWVPSIPGLYRELAGELVAAGARVLWGHSPHHILGCEIWPHGTALYSTGDLIDDYRVDQNYRNDRQSLYLLELEPGRVRRVSAFPISLRLGRAEPADAAARDWIESRLRTACAPLHSEVVKGAEGGFEIRRRPPGAAHAARESH
jgi:poly-gamma-glutamate capsule biosynthesis protein CapA/YwtB (metallophosphatase superfamily)